MAKLSLAQRTRPGQGPTGGGTKTQRTFLDFVVDGRSLFDDVTAHGHDLISCLWLPEDVLATAARDRLLLRAPGDLPSGRVALYVCPECGDLGCGGISARVTRDGPRITWSVFGSENNYEPPLTPLAEMGPFEFDFDEYAAVLGGS